MAKFKLSRRDRTRVKIDGLDEIIDKVESIDGRSRQPFRKGMRKATGVVRTEARNLIKNTTPTGRTYEIEVKGRMVKHQASAPGEPPATILGDILKSIKVKISRGGLSGRVLSADPKAHFMEYGTTRQAARPFLRPALERKKAEVLRILQDAYSETLKSLFGNRR